jgi:phosphate starvation-inducible PhoH-like protein
MPLGMSISGRCRYLKPKQEYTKLAKKKRQARITPMPEKHNFKKLSKIEIIPRNTKQEEYLQHLLDQNKKIVFALGPAGTGKTLLATLHAIRLFKNGYVRKLFITRPALGVSGEQHGFLPGGINEKMDPWLRPIFDIFEEYYTASEIKQLLEENVIEIAPLAYMRGRNFKNALVLFDEAQNATEDQMKMILTRVGENCRMFITGDADQRDHGRNGLVNFIDLYKKAPKESISLIEFEKSHVERSRVVKDVLDIYNNS